MTKHRLLSALVIAFGAIASAHTAVAAAFPLFDGHTFAGWEGDTKAVWRIENQEIVAGRPSQQQATNDFLCTTREFSDFDLRLKYKRGNNNGGIQFRSRRVPGSFEVAGYQADFAPRIDGFLYDEARRRKFLAQPAPETIAKLDLHEWNDYRVRAEGPRIRLWINDVLTVDYIEQDAIISRTGIIALQIHSHATEIRYKDIVIEELAPRTSQTSVWKPEAGFDALFNGDDLRGWHYKGDPDLNTQRSATDERYTASRGVLTVNPEDLAKGPHLRQLWTVQEFPTDFVLKLEFRASVNADSGIFIRGKQLQCRDYLVAGPYKDLKKYKPQDWNEIEIVVTGTRAHCTCNGEVLEAELPVPANGPIGLEADCGQMEYRRIQLKTLAHGEDGSASRVQ